MVHTQVKEGRATIEFITHANPTKRVNVSEDGKVKITRLGKHITYKIKVENTNEPDVWCEVHHIMKQANDDVKDA